MQNSYTNLKAILIAKITALVDDSDETIFAGVYGSNVTEPDGYPICYVMERKGGGNIVDTHRNLRYWEFSVVVHVALGNKKEADADESLLDAVDRVTDMFDQDPTLKDDNGIAQCVKVEVTPIETERARQDVAVIRSLMTVRVYDLVQRYASA